MTGVNRGLISDAPVGPGPAFVPGGERGLISRTAAGNRAYT